VHGQCQIEACLSQTWVSSSPQLVVASAHDAAVLVLAGPVARLQGAADEAAVAVRLQEGASGAVHHDTAAAAVAAVWVQALMRPLQDLLSL
jgi:hypothetical protein